MLTDPLFIISIVGMSSCLIYWIIYTVNNEDGEETFLIKNLSSISTVFGLLMLVSIFFNAGDLGIILFIGSIIALIVLVIGVILKNTTIISSSKGYFIPIFLIFILRTFIYEPYQIPSGSMLPGLMDGDFLLVNKHSYGTKINRIGKPFAINNNPDYGDVVVFIPSHNPVPYVKRLIGKPGDSVRVVNKQVFINGTPIKKNLYKTQEEKITRRYRDASGTITVREIDVIVDLYYENHGGIEYLTRNIRGQNTQYPSEWTVPEGHYFVMGDNRDNSNDSTKDVGFVSRENFFGKADYLFMTWECWTCVPSFSRTGKIK
ncbi:MAG: signal peptidase I [Gammaproteobacteria bacterium]|jgi:signal peptidase I|tara:strand:+ start:2770 stop:3720 length:951 start_codon:yes stop_codon:yes gene_type:complete